MIGGVKGGVKGTVLLTPPPLTRYGNCRIQNGGISMVAIKTCFILLLILALLLCGCEDVTQGANEPSQQTSNATESQTENHRSDLEILEEEQEQILAFWEAHEDEMEAIALDFIEFERENAECDYPYVSYRLQEGLVVSDGLGNVKKAEAPALEQQAEYICSLADCPFDTVSADVQHGWLQTDFCEFSAPSSGKEIFSISLIYFPDAEFELPEWYPYERVAAHWVLFINWRE